MTSAGEDASGPLTLAFDIGGSHLMAGILSPACMLLKGPNRVSTPHPTRTQGVVEALVALAQDLGAYDRVDDWISWKTASNQDEITGGVKVWNTRMDQTFTDTTSAFF